MTKTEARRALEREITKQLGQPGSPTRITNDGSVTLGWFVNQRFIPLKEAVWKEETGNTKKILIRLDIVEPLGEIPLVNFDKFSLQLHLNKLALTRSKDRVLQIRAYIRDIFTEAVDQDFLVKDPARKLKVPAQLRATDTTTLTWDQLRLALSELPLRDRILLELDMTNALRPSELFAFRWKRIDHAESSRMTCRHGVGIVRRRPLRTSLSARELPPLYRRMTSFSKTKMEVFSTRTTIASAFFTGSLAASSCRS